jgi:Domain of unknown function (DUF4157)
MQISDIGGLAGRATGFLGVATRGLPSLPAGFRTPADIGKQLLADVKAGAGPADVLFDQVKNQLSTMEQGNILRQLDALPGTATLEKMAIGFNPLDGILSVGKGLVNAGKDMIAAGKAGIKALKELGSKIKAELAALPSEAANALADSMRGPSARKLTAGEITELRKVFGNSIDLSNVRIVNGAGHNPDAFAAFKIGGNPAITEGNTVYIRSDGYKSDFSKDPKSIETLAHEFAHVHQFQKMGFGSFGVKYAKDLINIGDRNKVYDYRSRPNTTFRTETLEGQAQMVGDYARYRAGDKGRTNDTQARDIERRLQGTGLFGL